MSPIDFAMVWSSFSVPVIVMVSGIMAQTPAAIVVGPSFPQSIPEIGFRKSRISFTLGKAHVGDRV
jgi:hypothetical protein